MFEDATFELSEGQELRRYSKWEYCGFSKRAVLPTTAIFPRGCDS